ncbi:MAG: putative toxin-antitoxin system toxin component, PIN family, partial [Nitrospinaceae bacterium]
RFKASPDDLQFALTTLRHREITPAPESPSSIPIRDPDDAQVLASALEAGADILVTGDQDLLSLGDKAGIRIVDPRALLDMLA